MTATPDLPTAGGAVVFTAGDVAVAVGDADVNAMVVAVVDVGVDSMPLGQHLPALHLKPALPKPTMSWYQESRLRSCHFNAKVSSAKTSIFVQ